MKEKIENAIFETISDIDKWQLVLKYLVEATGASKGIITLRDRLTAELVIPNDVRQELGSPLIYGFSEQEVDSYISHYIKYDPWTKIENLYHPDEAYALSTHLDIITLKKHIFWEWLEPQNISDCIIFKIGESSSKYWIALNIYYPMEKRSVKKSIFEYLSVFRNTIRNAWKQGQKIRLSHVKSSYAEYFIEQRSQPSFLINSHKEVLQKNKKAKESQLDSDSPFLLDIDNTLRPKDKALKKLLQSTMRQLEKKQSNQQTIPQASIVYQTKHIQVSLIGKAESLLGENTALFLIEQHHLADKQLIWEDSALTRRERELVEILAKGGRVVDFQNHYKLAKSTAHMHWKHVKEKLNIKDRSDIYSSHQIYLQNL